MYNTYVRTPKPITDRAEFAKAVAAKFGAQSKTIPFMPNVGDDSFWTVDAANDYKVGFTDDDSVYYVSYRYGQLQADSLAQWMCAKHGHALVDPSTDVNSMKLYHFDAGTWGMVKTVATLMHSKTFTLEQLQGFAINLVDDQFKTLGMKLTDEFNIPVEVVASFGFKNPEYGSSYLRFIKDLMAHLIENVPSADAHLPVKQYLDKKHESGEWPQFPDYLKANRGFIEPPVALSYDMGE